jgi:acyl carrier protein
VENFDKVKDIIVDRLGVDAEKVTEDASFKDDLGIDFYIFPFYQLKYK